MTAAARAGQGRSEWAEQHAREIFSYEMLMYRELEQDSMTWQTPAIALTAQSFLLVIALDPQRDDWARVLTALLGVLLAVMTAQLLMKHIYLNNVDRAMLSDLEKRLGIEGISRRAWALPSATSRPAGLPPRGFWEKRSSAVLWRRGMLLLALANVVVAVVVAAQAYWPDGWTSWLVK